MNWQELENEQTIDLIDYIKCKEHADYRELAEAAFVAFTFRYSKEVIDKCRKVGKKWGYDSDTADTIAHRTFDRFWHNPFRFDKNKCGTLAIESCVKLYLFRIARNCFSDHNKELLEGPGPYDGNEEVIVEFPALDKLNFATEKIDELKKIHDTIEKALAGLSYKHKIIYLTYKAYEKDGFKLPRSLLKKLRDELELSQSSIRVYKKEVFETVDKFIKPYGTE